VAARPPDGEIDALRLETAELRASRKRLALFNDAERRDIERALHDGIQQQLVGLAANLQLVAGSVEADPATAKRLLAEMGRDAQQAMEETRRLADRIYPPLLESGGLGVALRSVAANADLPTRIDIAAGAVMPPEIAGTVYFCCLDVLEWASAGSPVAITVGHDESAIVFEIVAEGDVDVEGLPLRDRVEALGGGSTIESGSGHETRVSGWLPLPG